MNSTYEYYKFSARAKEGEFGVMYLGSDTQYESVEAVMKAVANIPMFNRHVLEATVVKVTEEVFSIHPIPLVAGVDL